MYYCRYKGIVKYKTAFYSFYLPVALAMYMVSLMQKRRKGNAKEMQRKTGEK